MLMGVEFRLAVQNGRVSKHRVGYVKPSCQHHPVSYRFATRDARSHLMHAFSKIQPPYSNMDDIPHNDRIGLAIADLETQEYLNYTATARKYMIERTTLSRRHKDIIGSKENQYFYTIKTFINVQEDVLIQYINDLNIREFSLIP
jgi:hypothetical protein